MAVSDSSLVRAAAPRRGANFLANLTIQRLLLLLCLVALWEVYARFFGDAALIAGPSAIIQAMGPKIFGDPKVVAAVELTLFELAVAYGLSVVVGVVIGVAIGLTEFGRRGFVPVVVLLYAVPQVVLLPLFVLMFGIGPLCKIAFGFSHGVFPVIISTITGMRTVNPLYLHGARAMGASRFQTIRHVIFPNMVPAVFAGFRLAMTVTLLGVLLAELFVSISGIGYFTQVFAETFNPAPLFALITVLTVMAVALNELVRLVEARFTRWKN
jgi:ABC-type nitrate/sulfonate/bicarbonate transport system permease component